MLKSLKFLAFTFIILWSWWTYFHGALGDPQALFLDSGCSSHNVTNLSHFYQNLNATLEDLRNQSTNKAFGTAKHAVGDDPLYGMFQCRDYLSNTDCAACVAAAATQIHSCSAGDSAHVMYDGCFLRYGEHNFFADATPSGNGIICGNQTASGGDTAFSGAAQQVLKDLQTATPKIDGYYAATKTPVAGGAIYAIAQCPQTVSQSGCEHCLTFEYNNIQSYLRNTDGKAFAAGCFMRYSETPFFADNQTIDITPYLKQGGSSKKWGIIGGVVGGVGLVVILLALLSLFARHRRSKKPMSVPRGGDILGTTKLKAPVNYKYNDLKAATNNFSEENRLGGGGFGNVYKGTLENGKIVAIKKLFVGQSNKMEDDFDSEVKLMSNVHHRNLVRLLGFCSKGQERTLVYEYMANASLDRFLFGNRKGSLNWKQRCDIILGTARGLAYLHEEFHVSIIHRDIKTGNILLDDELHPKIADFGLARLLPSGQSRLRTRFAGTLGYTAPEYAIHGQLSQKADTYSYGIVVLEIISGQKITEMKDDDDGHEYLLKRAWKLYEQGLHLELVDKSLDPNDYDVEEVKKIAGIALLCTQASAAMRPKMSEVVVLLTSKGQLEHMQPSMPVFVESNLMSRGNISASNATISNSIISAR